MAICPTCMTKYADTVVTCAEDGAALVPEEAFAYVDKDLTAGDAVGEYRIEGKLGEGGFGAVFSAVHPVIGKHAAIKVLSRQFSSNPQMVSRFIAEARAVNQIRHRNIIDIFAFGQLADGRQYYVMELLDGTPFDRYLAQQKRLSLAQALPILRGITRALDAAHGKGILHRDLKPENVYLVFDEDGGVQAKLLDFGLVKLLSGASGGEHKTKTGTPMGTPYYMSPEQCRGKDVDRGTDIYAFGALVFEVLTGRVPFNGDSPMDVLLKHMTEEPPRASEACAEVPRELDEPIRRMLAKEPSARPASVGEALESLVSAGNAAGALAAGAALPPPGPVDLHRLALAPTTGPGVAHEGAASAAVRVITGGGEAAAHGNTFLASEADVVPVRSSRMRLGAAIVVALVACGIGAGVVLTFARSEKGAASGLVSSSAPPLVASASSTATTAASGSGVVPSSSAAAGAKSEEIELTIETTPKDAKVREGALELGVAPGPFKVKAGAPITLTVVAKGYKAKEVAVTPTSSTTLRVALDKQAGPPARTGPNGQPISSDLENFDTKK